MPGFIIHLAEATMIMNYMEKSMDSQWKYEFLMGNLLPDTRLGAEKRISHFWSEESMENIARAPKLERFLNKYGHRLNEPIIFGYYAHLYLDERYVDTYWPTIIEFEDKEGNPEPRKGQIYEVELKRNGKKIPFEEFFTADNYYGDYTRSNHWLVERYHIEPPKYSLLENVNMDEVQAQDLKRVLDELEHICRSGHVGDEKDMAVFDLVSLDGFVQKTAKEFWEHVRQMPIIRNTLEERELWIHTIN